MEKQKNKTGGNLNQLQSGLKFTPYDLALNQEGYLTARQGDRLWSRIVRIVVLSTLIPLFAIASCLFLFVFTVDSRSGLQISLLCGIILLTLPAVIIALTIASPFSWSLYRDVKSRQIDAIMGPVVIDLKRNTLTVGSIRFTLQERALLRFRHLDPYAVYYAPNSKTLLSAEPLKNQN